MKKNQPKSKHLTLRINECQYNRLIARLRQQRKENMSNVLRESLNRYLNQESNKPKTN